MIALSDPKRLHDLPTGEVGAPHVADLPAPHEEVQGSERFLQRGLAIPFVKLVQVDVLRPGRRRLASQALTSAGAMSPRRWARCRL